MRHINDTTFISDNLGDLKPVVTIGGKPIDKFIPNLNMSFHNDEFFINLNRRDKQAINTTDKAEIDGIDKDIFYIDENGRFKWDIEFKERPSKNSWTWELKHAEGIEFYFQGELTPKEIADGCERPLEVVGSYAVYCNKANNKYRTGKLCHIYRPFCYDINGESIYADLLIADGQLTIAIDETWLNNAAYPVRLDPTIGYTTVGGSSWSNNRDLFVYVNTVAATSNGNASAIYMYSSAPIDMSNDNILGLYADNSGVPGSLITSVVADFATSAQWYSAAITASITSGNKYYPAFILNYNSASNVSRFYYDSSTGTKEYLTAGRTSMPNPWSSWDFAETNLISIYLEYTESGGALPAIINNYRQQGVM